MLILSDRKSLHTLQNYGDFWRYSHCYTESILPCDREVLVIGTASDDGGQVTTMHTIREKLRTLVLRGKRTAVETASKNLCCS